MAAVARRLDETLTIGRPFSDHLLTIGAPASHLSVPRCGVRVFRPLVEPRTRTPTVSDPEAFPLTTAQVGPNPTLTLLANSKSFSFSRLMCGQA